MPEEIDPEVDISLSEDELPRDKLALLLPLLLLLPRDRELPLLPLLPEEEEECDREDSLEPEWEPERELALEPEPE